MSKLHKNLIMEGPFSVQTPDTSGEVLMVAGADISSLQSGKALVNTEHVAPSDAEQSAVPENFKGFQSIVGRVVNAKKIFSDSDCTSERELHAWKRFNKPMIYGTIEIFDGDDAHPNAKAAASLIRMFNGVKDGPKFGVSVEGGTLKRNGNILERTMIRDLAGTLKPANRSATVEIVKDTNAPQVDKSMLTKTAMGVYEPLRKSITMEDMYFTGIDPEKVEERLANAIGNLRKTLTAGGTNAAPGSLTNGSALQSESQLSKLVKIMGRKPINKDHIKKAMPSLSDEQAEVIEKALKAKELQKNMNFTQSLFEEMFGKKS